MAKRFPPSSLFTSRSVLLLLLFFVSVSANDDCNEATVVTSLSFVAEGDTTNATADFPTPSDSFRNLTCGVSTSSRGVWYRIQDQENLFLKAILTPTPREGEARKSFKAALFRLENQDAESCQDSLQCMRSSEYYLSPPSSSDNGEIVSEWFAEGGIIYYLHVTGAREEDVGSFQLQIENLDPAPRPGNDRCDTALPLDNMGSSSTTSIGAWPGFENEDCGIRATSRGVYFSVMNGEDSQKERSVKVSGFDHVLEEGGRFEIAVLSGGDCSTCVTYQDFLFDDSESYTVRWMAQPSVIYTVLVAGEDYSDVGDFSIELESVDGQAFSDAGEFSTEMEPGDIENNVDEEDFAAEDNVDAGDSAAEMDPVDQISQAQSSALNRSSMKTLSILVAALTAAVGIVF